MDFKCLVNKESFKAILHHHLKSQVRFKFGNSVLKDILKQSENEPILSDDISASVANVSESDEYKEFVKTFLNSLNHLFEDKQKYIPKEDNQGTVSQCSSASSVNTASIDYISFDQFQDIIHTLSNGVNAEKLEALETFSRLPSLEHIIKRTLWPAVESGLHNTLLSNVSFLKEASIKVYTKMLSSSEPKVVQESFNSLIKHLVQNIFPSMNQNVSDFINKCKCVVEIIVMLNKFLLNIPNHWLRYPQQVIEDITMQSISILSYGSKSPNIFPVWLCVALCDKKSKWLKSILYGHVSRAFLLDALQKDLHIIKFTIQFCKKFSDNSASWNNVCCQNFAEISEITHIICFLSHLLRYSQGREIFNCSDIDKESSLPWVDVLDLVMKCAHKLCQVSCLACCSVVCDVVSNVWYHIWSSDDISLFCDSLIKILLDFIDIENLCLKSVLFITQCVCHMSYNFTNIICSQETEDSILDFTFKLLKYLINFTFDFPEVSSEALMLLNSTLLFIKQILSDSSSFFINLNFINTFLTWCLKINSISKALASSYSPGMKNNLSLETEQNISLLFISMLRKPNSIFISHSTDLFETSVNILLEKILNCIKFKSSVCPRDVAVLSLALDTTYSTKPVLNKSIIFKLSSVIWQLDRGDLENLSQVKSIFEMLIPSVFPDIFQNDILIDCNGESGIKLFQCLLLFPSLTKQEFIMFEEYNILALHVISLLACSILSSCYLQAKYKLSDLLFDLQSHNTSVNGILLIDPVSVIQNHILVKLYTIGGASEKVLPPETLSENTEDYNWPLFKNYPVPDMYYGTTLDGTMETTTSIKLSDVNLRDTFLEYIEEDLLNIDAVSQMLKASLNRMELLPALSRTLNFVTLDDVDHIILQDEILVGLEMAKRYGKFLNLVEVDDEGMLEKLLKAGICLHSTENRFQIDIFICTLNFIFKCDIQAWLFLETFAKSSTSLFIWYERILQGMEQNVKYVTTFNVIMEHCDIIVKKTLPLVYSAFQFSRVLPSTMFKYWTMHCYWNYLDFTEIAHFILVAVIFGGDFALYFFVSILKHMQSMILKNAHNFNLVQLLKQNSIRGFKLHNYMLFMMELSNIFHSRISKSIADILDE